MRKITTSPFTASYFCCSADHTIRRYTNYILRGQRVITTERQNHIEYNSIASNYVEARKTMSREPVEEYTIYSCLLRPLLDDRGSLEGKCVLDLACG
jgi:hypothetical protein